MNPVPNNQQNPPNPNSPIDPKVLNTVQNVIRGPLSCAPLLFAVIGFFMFFWGLPSMITNTRLFMFGTHTTGTVLKGDTSTPGTVTTTSTPAITFTTANGQVTRFQINNSTDSVKYTIGETVDVIYSQNNPKEAVINDTYQLWIGPVILTLIGGLFLGMGGTQLYKIWQPSSNLPTRPGEAPPRQFDPKQLKDNATSTFLIFAAGGILFLVLGIGVVLDEYQTYLLKTPGGTDFLSTYGARSLIFIPFSLIFVGLGLGGVIPRILRKNRGKTLKLTGKKATTTVCGYEYTGTRVNKVPGCKILTEYKENNARVEFKSEPFYLRGIEDLIRKGDSVDVYINPAKPEQYFLDIENLRPAGG